MVPRVAANLAVQQSNDVIVLPPPVAPRRLAAVDQIQRPLTPARTRLELPPTLGISDKTIGNTGYFRYQLDAEGRIWTRYEPIIAPAPFDLPVTEPPSAAEMHTKCKNAKGPYTYTYDEARKVIVVTPKVNARELGFKLHNGALVEAPLNEASQWHLHEGSGGPPLPHGVKIIEMQVAGAIIAARGSDGVLYLWKPTEPPMKWITNLGTPFGGEQRFPNMRDWAFGLSIGVKPGQRPTFENSNPYTDIDNYYGAADGSKSFYGFTATAGVLTEDGREIRYWDTGLPADFSRGFLTPERGRVVGEKIAQGGSTWLVYGKDQGVPGLWIKGYDHEMLGSCPGLRYTFESKTKDKDKIQDLADAQRFVPLPPWQKVDFPRVSGKGVLTDRIAMHTIGQGDAAREMVIEGKNSDGVVGDYRRALSAREWTFFPTGGALVGKPIDFNGPRTIDKPLTRDFPIASFSGLAGVKAVELKSFHHFATLDEASTLRFTLKSGKTVDLLLRTSDGYLPMTDDLRDSMAIGKGIGEEKVLTGTLEIPKELLASKDPEVAKFIAKMKPYHHVPNLFVLEADIDHVDLSTDGVYRKSDAGFDWEHLGSMKMSFKRDATGESEFEIRANAVKKPTQAMSVAELDRVIDDNLLVKKAMSDEVSDRRSRHMWLSFRIFWLNVLTTIVFFFLDLSGKSKSKHMGPISDLLPRFLRGHLHAHDWGTPDAYDRAKRILEQNIAEARRLKAVPVRPLARAK